MQVKKVSFLFPFKRNPVNTLSLQSLIATPEKGLKHVQSNQ